MEEVKRFVGIDVAGRCRAPSYLRSIAPASIPTTV
jgi:hypothetical protein